MVKLTLVRAVPARPDAVRSAYRSWILGEAPDREGETERSASAPDPAHLRFARSGRTRSGLVRVDGIVSFESGEAWNCRREISLNGAPFSRESERYFAEERPGGTDLTVTYEVQARSPLHAFLLEFAHRRLLVERTRE